MKKSLLILLMMLSVLLTACSSKYDPNMPYTCKWENGMVKCSGNPIAVESYTGNIATVNGYNMSLDMNAKDPSNILVNTQGVTLDNMTKYKDKYYYLEYLGSKMTMVKPIIEGSVYMVSQAVVDGDEGLTSKLMSDAMDSINLTNSTLYCDFGPFTLGNDYSEVKVTSEGASISGQIKVSLGSKGATTPVQITSGKKTVDMMMTSTEKYDYYEYEGYLIQIAKGLSLSEYITF